MARLRSLRMLLSHGQLDLAAHRLVYGLVKARIERNGKKRNCRRKSK